MCAPAIRAREGRRGLQAEREEPSGRWMYRLICQLIHEFCSPAWPPSRWSRSEGSVIETDDQIHQHRQLLPLMEGGRPGEERRTHHKRLKRGCSSCPSCNPKLASSFFQCVAAKLERMSVFFQVKRMFVFVLESIGVWCIYSVKVDNCLGFSAFYFWAVKVKVKQER